MAKHKFKSKLAEELLEKAEVIKEKKKSIRFYLSSTLVDKIEKLSSLTKEDKSVLVERILLESELLSDDFLSLLEQKVIKNQKNDNEIVNQSDKNETKKDKLEDLQEAKNGNENDTTSVNSGTQFGYNHSSFRP